jgi:hypothetical protein
VTRSALPEGQLKTTESPLKPREQNVIDLTLKFIERFAVASCAWQLTLRGLA